MGLLSIHASVQDDPDLIYLRHLNDLLYANASLSGSSLENNGTGGNIVLHYNQNDSSSDNNSSLLIPQFADSKNHSLSELHGRQILTVINRLSIRMETSKFISMRLPKITPGKRRSVNPLELP